MAIYTLKEWFKELENRFGKDKLKWAFKCPACGKVSTLQEYKDAGGTPNDAYAQCIGRLNGKGTSGLKVKNNNPTVDGCDWAAFGLFGTMGKGDTVISEDGKKTDVFAMAESEAQNEA